MIVQDIEMYTSVGLSLFVGWMLLGRLAGMGFSQEGRSYWLLKTAPLTAGQLIGAKFLAAYLPALALSWLFLLAIGLLHQPGFALVVVALCLAGNTGINLAFGIAGANLNWEDPRQMQRTSSSCLGAMASMIYLPVSLLLFFGPPVGLSALFSLTGIRRAGDWVGIGRYDQPGLHDCTALAGAPARRTPGGDMTTSGF
jgi:ABC-2 type transport system permease protein